MASKRTRRNLTSPEELDADVEYALFKGVDIPRSLNDVFRAFYEAHRADVQRQVLAVLKGQRRTVRNVDRAVGHVISQWSRKERIRRSYIAYEMAMLASGAEPVPIPEFYAYDDEGETVKKGAFFRWKLIQDRDLEVGQLAQHTERKYRGKPQVYKIQGISPHCYIQIRRRTGKDRKTTIHEEHPKYFRRKCEE